MTFDNLIMNIMEREEASVLIPLVGLRVMGLVYSIIYVLRGKIKIYIKRQQNS